MTTFYDPPEGWKYGFPRPYKPKTPGEPLQDTLRRDGYPESLIRYWHARGLGVRCRFWDDQTPQE